LSIDRAGIAAWFMMAGARIERLLRGFEDRADGDDRAWAHGSPSRSAGARGRCAVRCQPTG